MNYIYFRLAKYFFKEDGTSAIRALLLLSTFQGLLIIEAVSVILNHFLTPYEIAHYEVISRISAVAFCILLLVLNMVKYRGKYFLFREKWRHEELKTKRIRGTFVMLAIILPWVGIILSGAI